MSDETYFDRTGTCCPVCHNTDRIRYVIVPEHRREWTQGGEEHVEYMPETRDYTCDNCSNEWAMSNEPSQ